MNIKNISKKFQTGRSLLAVFSLTVFLCMAFGTGSSMAVTTTSPTGPATPPAQEQLDTKSEIKPFHNVTAGDKCGDPGPDGKDDVEIELNIGCRNVGNPLVDMFFAISKFLTLGAGIVMIVAVIISGIQFSSARENPQAKAAAMKRIYTVAGALLLFMFAYALLNWLTPGGTFNPPPTP